MDAGDVDDRCSRLHHEERLLREEERPQEIDIEDLPPVRLLVLLERLEHHDTGIVHDHVETAVAGERPAHGAPHLVLL